MSPMKWSLLNLLTQSSILQIVSFLSTKKIFNSSNNNKIHILNTKMTWKW